jgi:PHD/YefM family antitoxin component YafN of YafNO toxin-antitoxin module
MKTVDLAEATKALSVYADDLDDEPLILTVKDQPVAALVSLKHVDRESLALSTSPEFLRLMQAGREEVERGDIISLDDMKSEQAP